MSQVLRGRAATEHLTLNGHVQDLGTGSHSELISIQDTVFREEPRLDAAGAAVLTSIENAHAVAGVSDKIATSDLYHA